MANPIDLTAIAALILMLVVLILTVADDTRWILAAVLVQYFVVAWFTTESLPFTSSLAKAAAGIGGCLIMGLSLRYVNWMIVERGTRIFPSGKPFRVFGVLMVIVAAFGLSRSAVIDLLDIPEGAAISSMLLMAAALLLIGLFVDSFRVGTGLMVLLSGFEILYSHLEPSLAVIALIASVHLGIAMVVSYLLYRERGLRPA
jgi:hypothetical protein